MQRLDHAAIFVLIASRFTPLHCILHSVHRMARVFCC
ncbi:MAG: hypothetical protein ACRERU_04370 [Methylococcales bacterium]